MLRRVQVLIAAGAALLGAATPAGAATFTITKFTDPAPVICLPTVDCSLREAVLDAEATPGADTIVLPAGSYSLTIGPLPTITHPLTLEGAGAATTFLNGVTITPSSTAPAAGLIATNGGALTLRKLMVSGGAVAAGSAAPQLSAGAIAAKDASVTLDRVILSRNDAFLDASNANASGAGAIAAASTTPVALTITDSAIEYNAARGNLTGDIPGLAAGGIMVSGPINATISRSSITNNAVAIDTSRAGGIASSANELHLTNTTVSQNTAAAAVSTAHAGGILAFAGPEFSLSHVTMADNVVPPPHTGTTAGSLVTFFGGPTIGNSIIATGFPGNCVFAASAVSTGGNIEDSNDCGLTGPGDRQTTDPLLGALHVEGNTIIPRVQPLLPGSPAFGLARSATCAATDTRGVPRPAGGSCDAGAFEGVTPPANAAVPMVNGSAAVGAALTCAPGDWSGAPAFAFQWLRDGAPIGGATTASYTLTGDDVGAAVQCQVRATNSAGAATAASAAVKLPIPTPAPTAGPTPAPAPTPTAGPAQAAKVCIVPKLKGKTLASARTALKAAGCAVGKISRKRGSVKQRGRVISASPRAGTSVAVGTKVKLTVGR